jgi:hypothetical protein
LRTVSLLLIVTLLAASLPLAASASSRACCRTKSSCPMKQHHTQACAMHCGVSAPAVQSVAVTRNLVLLPDAITLIGPARMTATFAEPRTATSGFESPPPTPPPV